MSNTKLTSIQKAQHKKLLKALFADNGQISLFGRVTVLLVPSFTGANTDAMAVSVASPDEQKIRRKVGEFHALMNWNYGNVVRVPAGHNAYDLAAALMPDEG